MIHDALFSRRGLSLDRLRALVAVADAGGLSKAAPGDPVRQSQLSRQLSELEEFFGAPVTERVRGGLALTELGKSLAEHARFTFAGFAGLLRGDDAPRSKLVVGAGDSALHGLLLPQIGALRKAAPAVCLEVVALPAHEVLQRLRDGRVELGIARSNALPKDLHSVPLGPMQYALFVPRPLVPKGVAEREVLHRVPLALQVSDVDFAAQMSSLDVVVRCETFTQALQVVRAEHAAAVLPSWAAAELPARRFRRFTVPSLSASTTLHLAYSPRLLRLRPSAQRVIDTLAPSLRRALAATVVKGRSR